jgi:predicted heme/steroid binding protein/uncharacterized membrane protein
MDSMKPRGLLYIVVFIPLLIAFLWLFPYHLGATEEYAAQTEKDCETCHRTPEGGPDLTSYGKAFQQGGHQFPVPSEAFEEPSLFKQIFHLVSGYLHIVAGVIWFGTIFYVHVFITPKALTGGLPRSELMLGWSCITVLSLTGFHLTMTRISALSQLYTTRFGIILSIKIILFLSMVCIALFTTVVLRKRLKRERGQREIKQATEGSFTHMDLLSFDGTEQKPTYVAVDEDVYDLSQSAAWKEGRHMGQHLAGRDLTDGLSTAPHSREVLEKFRKVGKLWKGPKGPPIQVGTSRKTFIFLANSALAISFLILLCIALWRWG